MPDRAIAGCDRRLVVAARSSATRCLGQRRFGEFQKSLGLAKNILTVRLRALVEQGILKMAPASDGSAYQEYVLTPKGARRVSGPGRAAAMERGI